MTGWGLFDRQGKAVKVAVVVAGLNGYAAGLAGFAVDAFGSAVQTNDSAVDLRGFAAVVMSMAVLEFGRGAGSGD